MAESHYLVRYIGHFKAGFRPHGFPPYVYFDAQYTVKNTEGLRAEITSMMMSILNQGGMAVPREPNGVQSVDDLDARVFIPTDMFAYVMTETKLMTPNALPVHTEELMA